MPLTPKEMVRLLKKNGFVEKGLAGSHLKLVNPTTNRTVIVPMHGADLKKGTESAILRQAGVKK